MVAASMQKRPEYYREMERRLARTRKQQQTEERRRDPTEFLSAERFYGQRTRDRLTDRYVKYLVSKATGLRAHEIPQGIVELKRSHARALRRLAAKLGRMPTKKAFQFAAELRQAIVNAGISLPA